NKAGRKNTFAVHERSKTFFFTSQAAKSQFYTVYIAFVSIITAAVFLGVVLFSGLTGFVRPESFTQKRLNLHHAMTSFDLNNVDEFFSDLSGGSNLYGVNTVGGTNGGVLGTSNGISFNGVTALKVTSSKFNYPMYIRGYMGGQYENNCWNPLENDKEIEEITEQFAEIGCFAQDYDYIYVDSSRYYTGSQLDIMDITVKGACPKFIYAPYAAIYSGSPDLSKLGEKLKPHQDDYVRVSKSETSYSVVYWNFGNSSWSGRVRDLRSTEADYTSKTRKVMNAYYDYVCDNYLYSVKLDSLDKVYDEIVETYLDGDPYGSSYYDIVSAIADYFDSNYTYDLNPGATPKDRDFIDYFLTEQKKGYCSYFATVGTQLMRKFGYPARYTEGYMVLPSQQGEPMSDGRYEVNVPDKCAHAWTEVFIEGAGWVPAEFTPGYNNDNPNLSDKEKNIEKTVTTTTTTTAADESSKKENTGSSSSKSENSKAPSNSSKSAVSSSDTDSSSSRAAGIGVVGSSSEGGGAGGTVSPMVKTLIITLITVALGAAAVIVNRRHKLKVMEDRCTQKDLNKRAAEIYKYTLRYLSLLDIEVNRNITDLQQCDELLEKCHSKMITEIDDKLVDLALITVKAMMSSSGITEEEAEKAAAIMEHISQQVVGSSLNQLKMVSAKYLYCLY
ncbi:MAG: transglutaminase domain-containing protein, partial [Ruminococcus sp.]|nr:transglutaminase domain-containing protein [Ruminococcus sp.]